MKRIDKKMLSHPEKRTNILKAITITVTAFLFFALFGSFAQATVIHSRVLMGTIVEISFFDEGRFDKAAEKAFAEISSLEALFSSYQPTSDVSRINRSAGGEPVKVSPQVAEVVSKALDISGKTGGAFDPTFTAFSGLWKFRADPPVVPLKKDVEERLPFLDHKKVSVDTASSVVGIAKEGMSISLGGIAKGYIVGRAVEKLKEAGVERAIVKAGGDMFVFSPENKRPFRIGIKHPRKPEAIFASLLAKNGAVATSGDYERFFMKDGKRYHHIIDPKTGFPARASVSVTIISAEPTLADALSTSVFIMGPERGMAFVESIEGVEAVIVAPGGEVSVSSGLKGKVEFVDSEFARAGKLRDIGE